MKILIFNWRDITHPWAGGAEAYIHEIAKRLAKKHDITLFCGRYHGYDEEAVIDGVKIIRKGGKYSLYLYAPIIYLLKLRKKCDVIIDCENGIPFFTPLFSRKKKVCVMHHVHRDVFDIEMPFPVSSIGKFLETKLMPLVYKNTQFVAVSPSTKKEMIDLGIDKENIKIIFNGINGQFAPDLAKKRRNLVVYIGRIKKYKQLDHLVKVFKIVKNNIPDAEFIIAGRGNVDEIKAISEKLDLEIALHSEISEEKKIDILQKAVLFVTTSMKEGWGLTVIEANRCGTPVIAYNVPGLRDSIKNNENGLLIESGDIEKFANTIIKVLKDNNLQETLNKNAINWSKKFDWNDSSEKLLNILEN